MGGRERWDEKNSAMIMQIVAVVVGQLAGRDRVRFGVLCGCNHKSLYYTYIFIPLYKIIYLNYIIYGCQVAISPCSSY